MTHRFLNTRALFGFDKSAPSGGLATSKATRLLLRAEAWSKFRAELGAN
jgi:hypothetical protein